MKTTKKKNKPEKTNTKNPHRNNMKKNTKNKQGETRIKTILRNTMRIINIIIIRRRRRTRINKQEDEGEAAEDEH